MNIGEFDELLGKYCRVISKVPEVEGVFHDVGTVKHVSVEHRFILVETKQGLKQVNMDDVFDVFPMRSLITTKFSEEE